MDTKKHIVFLDRDGVINDGTAYYTYSPEQFRINPGVIEGLQLLQKNGYECIVVTNQSGVAKGVYTIEDVHAVHIYMKQQLAKYNIHILGIYVCPHHPDVSACVCRKPGTGMFEQAAADFSIDFSASYMIGDSARDIEAAQKMGITGIRINKNESILPYCEQILLGNV